MAYKTSIKNENKFELKEPEKYKLILHNDDYTTMEFVVKILKEVFNKTNESANKLMMTVHTKGSAVVGIYPHDIAFTKLVIVNNLSKENGFPLKITMEKE